MKPEYSCTNCDFFPQLLPKTSALAHFFDFILVQLCVCPVVPLPFALHLTIAGLPVAAAGPFISGTRVIDGSIFLPLLTRPRDVCLLSAGTTRVVGTRDNLFLNTNRRKGNQKEGGGESGGGVTRIRRY
jgi:hypothetical protein